MRSNFDTLINSILLEQDIVLNAEDMNTPTAYDTILKVVKKLINDPRDLLPAIDIQKFIKQNDKDKDSYEFEWRYGNDVYVKIQVSPESISIYDIKEDKIIFNAPSSSTAEHDTQNVVYSEIEKLITQSKEKQELGVEEPLEIGNTNTSMLPGAEKETNSAAPTSKTSEYLAALKK
jgi:hypothetical protein